MKIVAIFFVEIYKLILNFVWQLQRTQNSQNSLKKKKRNDCRTYIAYFKTYFKDTVIKLEQYWPKKDM